MKVIAIRRDTYVRADWVVAVFIESNTVFVRLRTGDTFSGESCDDIEDARQIVDAIATEMEDA